MIGRVQKVFAVTIAEMITIKIRVTIYKSQIGTWYTDLSSFFNIFNMNTIQRKF